MEKRNFEICRPAVLGATMGAMVTGTGAGLYQALHPSNLSGAYASSYFSIVGIAALAMIGGSLELGGIKGMKKLMSPKPALAIGIAAAILGSCLFYQYPKIMLEGLSSLEVPKANKTLSISRKNSSPQPGQ